MEQSRAKVEEVRSAFDDLFNDKTVARNLRLRSQLMMIIQKVIEANGFTQQRAAEFFGTSQPRISDLLRGRIEKFSIDMLVGMADKAGWAVEIDVSRKKIA